MAGNEYQDGSEMGREEKLRLFAVKMKDCKVFFIFFIL